MSKISTGLFCNIPPSSTCVSNIYYFSVCAQFPHQLLYLAAALAWQNLLQFFERSTYFVVFTDPLNIYMFPSPRTGGMYHPDSIVKLHEKILNDAGIEHLRFHDLRHSFATYALQSGADVKTLSCMLGHYSAGFTLNTYCHATRDMQADAARKIGGFMSAQTGIG